MATRTSTTATTELAAAKSVCPYVLAPDSDGDDEVDAPESCPPLSGDGSLSRLSAEDSQHSAAGQHSPVPSTAAAATAAAAVSRARKAQVAGPTVRSLPAGAVSALCAEKLLSINESAAVPKERAAALAQLSRFRGAYRALCRGAPFSVWVRYEAECEKTVVETADFFHYELSELIAARHERTRAAAQNPGCLLKPCITENFLPGLRFVGCRATLPAGRGSAQPTAGGKSVCRLQGTWSDEDSAREEEARAFAMLPQGEQAVMAMLSMEDGAASHPRSSPSHPSTCMFEGFHAALRGESLSPFAIYQDEGCLDAHSPLPGLPVMVVVPLIHAPSTAPRQHTARKRHRESSGANDRPFASARGLDFDDAIPPPRPIVSLSDCAIEQQNHRTMQDWLHSSQNAFALPY